MICWGDQILVEKVSLFMRKFGMWVIRGASPKAEILFTFKRLLKSNGGI